MPSAKQELLGRIPSVEILLQAAELEWATGVPRADSGRLRAAGGR